MGTKCVPPHSCLAGPQCEVKDCRERQSFARDGDSMSRTGAAKFIADGRIELLGQRFGWDACARCLVLIQLVASARSSENRNR